MKRRSWILGLLIVLLTLGFSITGVFAEEAAQTSTQPEGAVEGQALEGGLTFAPETGVTYITTGEQHIYQISSPGEYTVSMNGVASTTDGIEITTTDPVTLNLQNVQIDAGSIANSIGLDNENNSDVILKLSGDNMIRGALGGISSVKGKVTINGDTNSILHIAAGGDQTHGFISSGYVQNGGKVYIDAMWAMTMGSPSTDAKFEVNAGTLTLTSYSWHGDPALMVYGKITPAKMTAMGSTDEGKSYTIPLTSWDKPDGEKYFTFLDADKTGYKYIQITPGAVTQYTLTGAVNDNAMGSIDPATQTVNANEDVIFTATPNDGYVLDHWTVDGAEVARGEDNTLTVTADGNKTVMAYFKASPSPTSTTSTTVTTVTTSSSSTNAKTGITGDNQMMAAALLLAGAVIIAAAGWGAAKRKTK